jgi:hypothetical protein
VFPRRDVLSEARFRQSTDFGIGLGRAGAHEVSHYLLGMPGHGGGALMRSRFVGSEWFSSASAGLFTLSPLQVYLVYAKLRCGTPGPIVPQYHQVLRLTGGNPFARNSGSAAADAAFYALGVLMFASDAAFAAAVRE